MYLAKSHFRQNATGLSTQFLVGIFAARAVVNWCSRSVAKSLYYSVGDRLHFRRNKQHAVELNTKDKHREKCMYTSFFKREPRTIPYQYTEFQKSSAKIIMDEKQSETSMFSSFFKA